MTASHYLDQARQALASRDGISKPKPSQLTQATVYADLAQAHALDRIATALETLAAHQTAPATDGATLQPAIHHTH